MIKSDLWFCLYVESVLLIDTLLHTQSSNNIG